MRQTICGLIFCLIGVCVCQRMALGQTFGLHPPDGLRKSTTRDANVDVEQASDRKVHNFRNLGVSFRKFFDAEAKRFISPESTGRISIMTKAPQKPFINDLVLREQNSVRFKTFEAVNESNTTSAPASSFPTNLWGLIAHHWTHIVNATEFLQQTIQNSPEFPQMRQAVKDYNKLVARAVDAPVTAADYSVAAIRNITQPVYVSRTRAIETRDAVLDAFMRRQKASWSPFVAEAERVANGVKQATKTFHNMSGTLLLNQLTDSVFHLRSFVEDVDDRHRSLKRSALICLVNPKCCGDPSPCFRPSSSKPEDEED